MNERQKLFRISRRDFIKASGLGLLAIAGSRVFPVLAKQSDQAAGVMTQSAPRAPAAQVFLRLAATDGFIHLPGRTEDLYVFGFVDVPVGASVDDLDVYKGKVRVPAPIIGVNQGDELYLTLTNIGLVGRPDLDDSHTIHWHGFRNPIAVFDGVPEVSIAVPVGRDFPYYYRPEDPGTYMYHCHFEDVEHVQMGMNGIVYVRPAQNFAPIGGDALPRLGGGSASEPVMGYAYNDGFTVADLRSTAYNREFTFMLNEVDTRPHDNLISIQEFLWTDYKPNYWIMNGRTYPDTLAPSNPLAGDPLQYQPISSLMQVNPGDRVLMRIANLGYEQHSMQLPGITMRVVGEDATHLRGPAPFFADLSYRTATIYLGPGEARDVIFTAPPFAGDNPDLVHSDAAGNYNAYRFFNRNYHQLISDGQSGLGLGGMVTEVRVYDGSPLPLQSGPNETYL